MSRTGLDKAQHLTLAADHFRQPSTFLFLRLRLALALGKVVVLVAPAGAGKTFFMNRLFPGKVINHSGLAARGEAPIRAEDIPAGSFAIDEPAHHSPSDLARALGDKHGCVLAFQAKGLVRSTVGEMLAHRRVLMLEVI